MQIHLPKYRRAQVGRASPRRLRLAAHVFIAMTAISPPGLRVALAQEASVAVTWQPIPLADYKSWSLFLVCNTDWARPQQAPKLKQLYQQFLVFGEAIGPSHLAVWLAAARRWSFEIDSTRSARFCEVLKLPQTEGPYLVLTGKYPGAAIVERPDSFNSDLGNHLVLSLNGISAVDTTHLLDTLAKQLVSSEFESRDVQSEEFWRVLQNAFQTSKDPVLSEVSVTFKTTHFSTAIAQPSTTLAAALKTRSPAIPSGATWSATRTDNSPLRLTAFVADRTSLQFDSTRNGYAGIFVVALQNLDDRTDRGELRTPVTIAVKAPGASAFNPSPVRMSRLSEWMDVEVLVPDPRERKYPVSVSAGPDDRGASVELDVSRPRVALRAVSTNILGWGLGTTQITVASRVYAGALVHLTADGGNLDPGSVRLDNAGSGSTTLRSDASPNSTIGVDPSQWEAEPLKVTFRPPYLFFAAAIFGGLLGAFLRGKGRHNWSKALAIGVASAILMTVGQAVGFTSWIATAIGSNPIATSGEAVVFFLGAIAALIGVSALIPGAAQMDTQKRDKP